MTGLAGDLRDVGAGLLSRYRAAVAALARTTPAVLMVRLLVFGGLLGAAALAVPPVVLLGRGLLVAAVGAAAAALFPRTWIVGAALLTVVGAWLVTTWVEDTPPPVWRIAGLATALYVAHAAAALAAVLPHDCAVAPSALGRWGLRVAAALLAGLGFGVAGLALLGRLPVTPTVAAPVAGALVAAGLAGLLAWLARR